MNIKTISTTILFIGLGLLLVSIIVIPVGGMAIGADNREMYMTAFATVELIVIVGFVLTAIAYRKG